MRFPAKCVITALISATVMFGQSFKVSASKLDNKTPGTFSVTMESPPGKEPVALQWEFSLPPVLAISTANITLGQAAESARKSLTCAMRSTKAVKRRLTYACILAGGHDPISNGVIVVVQYQAQWDLKGAPVQIAIENILGASADLHRISIPDVKIDIQ